MSHTLAARCTVCGVTAEQKPWKSAADPNDGHVHQWHPDCLPTQTQGETL